MNDPIDRTLALPTGDQDAPAESPLYKLLAENASADRAGTIATLLQFLEALGVIRPVRAGMVYDHRLIGEGNKARAQLSAHIAAFLFQNNVIEFVSQRDPQGRGTELGGQVLVVIREGLRNAQAGRTQ